MYTVHCVVHAGMCTLYTVYCTVQAGMCTLYAVYCTVQAGRCTLYNVHCTVQAGRTEGARQWRYELVEAVENSSAVQSVKFTAEIYIASEIPSSLEKEIWY